MVEATQEAAVTATSKKIALQHFQQAQLDLKSFHNDAWAQFLGSPDTCTP